MNAPERQLLFAVPPWASAWGVDEFGRWVELEYKDVVQRMRWVEPGRFWMGSPDTEPERSRSELLHEVELTEGYWLADTACTQDLWVAVMGENPSEFKRRKKGEGPCPVEMVSWEDCQVFLGRLNQEIPGLDVRLPTEAEWENACRAGTQTPFSFGADITTDQVNYNGTPYAGGKPGKFRQQTEPVKSFPPNSWGFYEMHGNVWEWCLDEYASYSSDLAVDPFGSVPSEPAVERQRVQRGGSWFSLARYARSADRIRHSPDIRFNYLGFRFARGRQYEQTKPARAEGARGPEEAERSGAGPRATGAR